MLGKYLILIILILFFITLILGYSVNLFSGIKFDKEGIITFEQKPKPGAPMIAPQFSQDYLVWQNFSKKDLLFVAWYKLNLSFDKDFGREISDLNFTFQLPGKIVKHNATKIEKGQAIWEGVPAEAVFILETRLIRWWLIILTLIFGIFEIWLSKRKKYGQSS